MSQRGRHILLMAGALLVSAYIVFALSVSSGRQEEAVCHEVRIVVQDSTRQGFVNPSELAALLQAQGVYPLGQSISTVSTERIEAVLDQHPLLKEAECYITPSHRVVVAVRQRIPKFRVMGGEDYFVDMERHFMPVMQGCAADVPVVTGRLGRAFAEGELFDFVDYLERHPFWQSQITQIEVAAPHDIHLIPRVGNHVVVLGGLDDYERKLDKLETLYVKGFGQVGWKDYKVVDLRYKNQVVCRY